MDKYNPKYIEKKWQDFWEENPGLFAAKDTDKAEKKYILDMFPYPSSDGLHTGHVESYTATDIVSRYLRMNGKNVLHPQGWDAFGLPAENFAIKTRVHPQKTTANSIKNFKRQMKMIGFSYDWSRVVNTSDPKFYKWTQWFFLLLYKNGLAYKKKAKVNWCPSCQTVLANEQVENGACERCKNDVIQKDLEQWFFKITEFIEDKPHPNPLLGKERGVTAGLLSGLEKIDWPESTKSLQKNWIGKSEGAVIKFSLAIAIRQLAENKSRNKDEIATSPSAPRNDKYLEVFTTRLDTIYGCTYCVVAPEHEIIKNYKSGIKNYDEVVKYVENSKKKTDLDRMEAKDKTGVEIECVKVINPFTNEEVPLYVADYVLAQYGTGAVMAVPAHDERDLEFAKKYNLQVKGVVFPLSIKSELFINEVEKKLKHFEEKSKKEIDDIWKGNKVFTEDGILWKNSEKYNGLTSKEAREKMTAWLEKNKLGSKKINYKLRDWLIGRQRYWGAPIPIIYCEKCGTVPVPEKDLPVKLPDDVDFMPTGESPLTRSKNFQNVKCPVCGRKAKRESDTMDTFVCSSWYYFRYADPKNEKEFAAKEKIKKWLPVDLYVGGAEHSVLHLLYSRFFTKVLHNLGYIDFDEPFTKLRHQGIILSEDGRKMSKSLGNVVNPDEIVQKWGADSLRCFEMFMGPLEDMKPWNTRGIVGIYRFLERVWKMQYKVSSLPARFDSARRAGEAGSKYQVSDKKYAVLANQTIKKVTEDIENLKFNTAISSLMILANAFEKEKELYIIHYTLYLILLSPFAPHLAEELWNKLGNKESIFKEKWPAYDPKLIKEEKIEMVIQVNGKVRDKITVDADVSEKEAKELAMGNKKVTEFIAGKEIKKVIFVKGRLINVVI